MKISLCLRIVSISALLVLSSCVSKRQLTYLKFSDKASSEIQATGEGMTSVTPAAYKLMPHDNLFIRVVTPDPQWSSLFNVMPVGAGGSVTEESARLYGYPVDDNGFIEIPFVGKVMVAGKTLAEIKTELDVIFKNYVTDASITIRLVNNYISVIGEVSIPGQYPITKDRLTILEAISLAGDLTVYGDRQKLLLIRPSPYGPMIKDISLSDRSILSSEYYYVMPNDIIYAQPVKGRPFQVNSSIYSLFLTTITTVLVLVEFFR
jgi:polysaccharide export outer membrane protein